LKIFSTKILNPPKEKRYFRNDIKEHLLSKAFENLLDDQVYLTNDEIFLKQHTGESIRMFYATYEQITLNKIKLYYDISRCRFKIDEHRVELKQKIDDTALDLIERTREYEASYLKAIRPFPQTGHISRSYSFV